MNWSLFSTLLVSIFLGSKSHSNLKVFKSGEEEPRPTPINYPQQMFIIKNKVAHIQIVVRKNQDGFIERFTIWASAWRSSLCPASAVVVHLKARHTIRYNFCNQYYYNIYRLNRCRYKLQHPQAFPNPSMPPPISTILFLPSPHCFSFFRIIFLRGM